MPTNRVMSRSVASAALALLVMLLIGLGGCGGGAVSRQFEPREPLSAWSDARWAKVLSQVVTPDGYVRWEQIQNNTNGVRDELFRYVGQIGAASPDNRPDLFPTAGDNLAYWINAYNAIAMYAVVKRDYPGNTLASIPPGAIYLIDAFPFGGRRISLDAVEKSKVRGAGDPRVHFALNCMSHSCPPLRSEPYAGSKLDAQLAEQGHRYLSDARAVERDGDRVKLSDIFTNFYKHDFVDAYERKTGTHGSGLLEAIRPYAAADSPVQTARSYSGMGYDWSLNRPPPGS
jgi:hypothetical protein